MKVILVYAWAAHPGVHKLADTLSRNGYDVKLLVWDRDGMYQKVEKIHSFTAFRFHYKAPWGKLAALLYFPIWWIYELYFLWREHPDIVHACNFSTLPPAIIMKLVMRIKVCYTIYDLFGSVYPGSMPAAIRNLAIFMERVGIGFADILFLVSEAFFEDISSARIKKLVYIYNSPEDYLDVQLSPEYKLETCIFYAGWMAKYRGLEDMINAVSALHGIKLVMAGKEVDKEILEYGRAKLDNFQYLGFISYEEVLRRSMQADILFVFYDPNRASFRYSTPNKLFEAMMCGKPIIVNDGIAASKIVTRENCGIVVPYGDVDAIKEAVLRLKNDPALREELGRNGRRAYETSYSWEIMERRLIEAYKELAN